MKIFLDDVRKPQDCLGYMHIRIGPLNPIYQEEWLVVKNYDEFKAAVHKHFPDITHISFDHDLADEHYDPVMMVADDDYNHLYDTFKERTGLDCAKWLKEYYEAGDSPLPIIFIHSMNPAGRRNIEQEFSK